MASPFGDPPIGLSAQIDSLSTLLSRQQVMRIPRHQRPYVWEESEIGQLIEDLRGAYERRASFYFVGQMVFVRDGMREVEVADGQQRITTLTMILAYARDRISHRAPLYQSLILLDNATPRLRLRPADENFYHEYVQKPGRFRTLAEAEGTVTDSQGLLCAAAEVICRLLDGMSTTQLDAFATYICRATLFNIIDAGERGAALTVFNAMTRAGRLPSGPDVLKSELLERAQLSDEEAEAAARQWETLEDEMGRDAFAYLIEIVPQLLFGEPILSPGDLGAFRRAIEERSSPQEFLQRQLPQFGAALRAVSNATVDAGPHTKDVNRRILCMHNTPSKSWQALVVRFLAEFGHDHDAFATFVRGMDLLTFAMALNRIEEDKDARLARVWRAGADKKKLYGPGGAVSLTLSESRALLARIRGPFRRDSKTDSGLRRVLLARMNAALPGGAVPNVRGDDVTVEHILPPSGGRSWEPNFPTPELRSRYAHLLGNWILLTRAQNKIAARKSYAEKRDLFFKTPGAPIWAITRDIESIEEWTWEAIDRRHSRLIAVLAQDLGIDLS